MRTLALSAVLLGAALIPAAGAADDPPVFHDYQAIFRYIVSQEDVPEDHPDLFRLAAESTVDHVGVERGAWLLIVKPDLFDKQHVSMLRGAQGNGSFYVFRETADGFRLLGTMTGNGYKVGTLNGRVQLQAMSHVSAEASGEVLWEVEGDRLIKK